MPSAKQIAWRKKFAKLYGKKKKGSKSKMTKVDTLQKMDNPNWKKIPKGSGKSLKQWLKDTIKTREANPQNYSSDYSRGELRGYKEALAQLTGKPTRFGR